jgi:hypothetical protein
MAAKVSIQDIRDAGFRPEQFGSPLGSEADGWDTPGGYLERLITRAEAWARGRYGAGYDAVPAGSPTEEHLRAAELCWSSAQLWRRRAAYIDSNAASALENLIYRDRLAFEEQAANAMQCADEAMALAIDPTTPAGTAAVLVSAISGPWGRGGRACAS